MSLLRSPTFSREQVLIWALTSFNYLMKQVQRRRLLPPTFGALTSKLIVPNSLWISVPPLFPSLYMRRVDLRPCIFTFNFNQYRRRRSRREAHQVLRYWFHQAKKKTPWTVCASTGISDKRAETKLRLAVEHIKRTISSSPGAATCSVESLKDSMDYTDSINRMRFDMVVNDRWYTTLVSPRCTLRLTVCTTPACYTIDVKAWGCSSNI